MRSVRDLPNARIHVPVERARKLRLEIDRNLTDFIEEYGSLRCQFETADSLCDSSRKAPFSCPNNSLSSSPVGIAAQFSLTKECLRRWLRFGQRAQSTPFRYLSRPG